MNRQPWTRRLVLAAATAFGLGKARVASAAQPLPQPMPRDRFWTIIEATTPFQADPARQLTALRGGLTALSEADVLAFDGAVLAAMNDSYDWGLWGAAYVAHGGASDDGFEYFRLWLISKGRTAFEAVCKDPDHLADLAAPLPGGGGLALGRDGVMEFESFAYVAREVWGEKARRDPAEIPDAWSGIYAPTPKGTPFKDDPAWLAAHYPKLWRRFGAHPLG